MAETGDITNLHPPGNGTTHGVAFITPTNGGKKLIAQTPDTNNGEPLKEGTCYYTLTSDGKHVERLSNNPLPDTPF